MSENAGQKVKILNTQWVTHNEEVSVGETGSIQVHTCRQLMSASAGKDGRINYVLSLLPA